MQHYNILEAAGLSQIKKRERGEIITPEDKIIAERLDFNFYDGDRKKGYGGYYYDGRWIKVAQIIKERYKLNKNSTVLIDRCHKGFLVFDLMRLISGVKVYGIHPGNYAINHAMEGYGRWALLNGLSNEDPKIIEEKAKEEVIPFLINSDSDNMPFKDKFFDCVISIESACSYSFERCKNVIKEIVRVTKDNGKNSYIQNDSWLNEKQKEKLMNWSLLCKTFLSISEWEELYKEQKFDGDYGFTIID
ncbi:MAG: methyltransferase domain-containing protein [Candidatus Pacearchaeota archaeon]